MVDAALDDTSASPSFGPNGGGTMPARASAGLAGTTPPSPSTQPPPASTSAMWASGARSASPTEPSRGIAGCTPAFSRASSASAVGGDTPEQPTAKPANRASMAARTSSTAANRPTPTARAHTTRRCASPSPNATGVSAAAPSPVVTPYTGILAQPSSAARLSAMRWNAASPQHTRAPSRATRATSPTDRAPARASLSG